MCGWCSCEAACASTRNRAIWRGSIAAPNGEDLQCHVAAQRVLHGLEHDAHAAAAQLAQNLEVAELGSVAARRLPASAVPGAATAPAWRAGHLFDQVQALQAGAQPLGDRRMLRRPTPRGPPAGRLRPRPGRRRGPAPARLRATARVGPVDRRPIDPGS